MKVNLIKIDLWCCDNKTLQRNYQDIFWGLYQTIKADRKWEKEILPKIDEFIKKYETN